MDGEKFLKGIAMATAVVTVFAVLFYTGLDALNARPINVVGSLIGLSKGAVTCATLFYILQRRRSAG